MNILMVEDNPADADLTLTAFEHAAPDVKIDVVGDGIDAMAYMRREAAYADAPVPDLLILDLGLPRKAGRSVLDELKRHPKLRHIPVIVLSVSDAEGDIEEVYRLNGNCYVVKPVDLDGMYKLARSLVTFWRLARLSTDAIPK